MPIYNFGKLEDTKAKENKEDKEDKEERSTQPKIVESSLENHKEKSKNVDRSHPLLHGFLQVEEEEL